MDERDGTCVKIFKQLNKTLNEKMKNSNIIQHNLEKGLGNDFIEKLLSDLFSTEVIFFQVISTL